MTLAWIKHFSFRHLKCTCRWIFHKPNPSSQLKVRLWYPTGCRSYQPRSQIPRAGVTSWIPWLQQIGVSASRTPPPGSRTRASGSFRRCLGAKAWPKPWPKPWRNHGRIGVYHQLMGKFLWKTLENDPNWKAGKVDDAVNGFVKEWGFC